MGPLKFTPILKRIRWGGRRLGELLGKSIGMWIDHHLQISGQLNDSHVTALLALARKRQAEPVDLKTRGPVALFRAAASHAFNRSPVSSGR